MLGCFILEMHGACERSRENERNRSQIEYYSSLISQCIKCELEVLAKIQHHFFKPTMSNTRHCIN